MKTNAHLVVLLRAGDLIVSSFFFMFHCFYSHFSVSFFLLSKLTPDLNSRCDGKNCPVSMSGGGHVRLLFQWQTQTKTLNSQIVMLGFDGKNSKVAEKSFSTRNQELFQPLHDMTTRFIELSKWCFVI